MKGKFNFKLGALCAILTAVLVSPALGQGKADPGEYYREQKIKIIKQMKLAPDKEKAVLAVEEKYASQRKEIIANLKKSNEALETALKAASPDEARLKELVAAITTSQEALFNSFKSQQGDELALMTPVEQGKYLLALGQWRHQMMDKSKTKESKEKKK